MEVKHEYDCCKLLQMLRFHHQCQMRYKSLVYTTEIHYCLELEISILKHLGIHLYGKFKSIP